jgi:hypothetical protein
MNLAHLNTLDTPHAALAAELATKLLPLPEIIKRYDLTPAQLKDLLRDQQFRHMVNEFRREWHSPLSARERVRLKSSLAVEDGLIELYRIFKDLDYTPSARLDAFKQLVGLADMQPKKDAVESGPSFSLTLNLGGESRTVTIDATPGPALIDADADAGSE